MFPHWKKCTNGAFLTAHEWCTMLSWSVLELLEVPPRTGEHCFQEEGGAHLLVPLPSALKHSKGTFRVAYKQHERLHWSLRNGMQPLWNQRICTPLPCHSGSCSLPPLSLKSTVPCWSECWPPVLFKERVEWPSEQHRTMPSVAVILHSLSAQFLAY